MLTCIGAFLLSYSASSLNFPGLVLTHHCLFRVWLSVKRKEKLLFAYHHHRRLKMVYRIIRYPLCGVGGSLLLAGLIALSSIDQDDARHTFGHSGGK